MVLVKKQKVMVIDDEVGMRELLEIVLNNDGYDVLTVATTAEACSVLEKDSFDIIVTDLWIDNDRDAGMRMLEWLQSNDPEIPAIMMTAHGSVETAIEAMKLGAADYVLKPFSNDEIRLLIARALEKRDLVRENVVLRKEQARRGDIDTMVGKSRPIEEVKETIRRVSAAPSTVVILGESGTGKELVARSLHRLSGRSDKAFVAINCGGIPDNLLESELFGHKKGSFTGATEDKIGLFVMADGGTLFLDEVGELPFPLQVKLLRVLGNNVVRPIGGTKDIEVDVRLLSATNRNLEEMVKSGAFREDLYYRLNVIPINVPSLRERCDDIPLLARHFVVRLAEKLGRETPKLTQDAMDALCKHDWPGNVRELENVLERAVALCSGESITVSDLPDNVKRSTLSPAGNVSELPADGLDLEAFIADLELNLIRQALRNANHSQKGAASLLGLTTRSLRYRLQKYGLDNNRQAG